ncbi:hypothetical protein V3G39_15560 [Dermatophilaceae bacterium Sec6.4]
MKLERMRVEEGFLDGLDVTFASGLNVVIGARGVGKTSLVELIRYGLRLPHLDERRSNYGRLHAEAVLGGGRVSITYLENDQRRTVSRSANDPDLGDQHLEPASTMPEVLGQNELEGIGLDPRSRLRLVDARASLALDAHDPRLRELRTEAESITVQLRELGRQRESHRQEEILRPSLVAELADARAHENELLSRASAEVADLRGALAEGTTRLSATRSQREELLLMRGELTDIAGEAAELETRLANLLADYNDPISGANLNVSTAKAFRSQTVATSKLHDVVTDVAATVERLASDIAAIDDQLRPLRIEFEQLQAGAGEAAQLTSRLERQLSDVDSRLQRLPAIQERSQALELRRDGIMIALDQIAEAVWIARSKAVHALNQEFTPRIRVVAEHFGDRDEYVSRLADALRGSGLQHNQLASWIADRVTPKELVAATENSDAALLATLGEITPNRVERLISHLAMSEKLGEVLTSRVDDVTVFELLVGNQYKSSETLSTGQRCALVLPLLLAEAGRTLILDQPEDHLDNAYLVDNTVRSLSARSRKAQTIVVTHNANIPVLGNADRVIALQSDGRRGYVHEVGALTEPKIVSAITRLMEGGSEAFAQRAAFYRTGGNP